MKAKPPIVNKSAATIMGASDELEDTAAKVWALSRTSDSVLIGGSWKTILMYDVWIATELSFLTNHIAEKNTHEIIWSSSGS
jgi:hypothetical protein